MANQKTPRPKTQREILLSNPVQDTYKNPETGETTGNPNRVFPEKNRATIIYRNFLYYTILYNSRFNYKKMDIIKI